MNRNVPSLRLLSAAITALGALILLPQTASAAADDDGKFAAVAHRYDTYCVQCHGVNRNGRGINSRDMSVQPRDHSDAKGMGGIPDQELFDAIKKGGLAVNKSVLMPAWGGVMNDDEIHELVAYLRHVCNCGSDQ
jgi:cytochrome c oxidase cbb3-type subunit 3